MASEEPIATSAHEAANTIEDQVFGFVLMDVLGQNENSPLIEALLFNGITDLPSLIGMSNLDIDELTVCQPGQGPSQPGELTLRIPMHAGPRGLLKAFKVYVHWL